MYFKAIPVSERFPALGKYVTTIDSAGEHRVYCLTEHGWHMREPDGANSPNNNLPILYWLEETDLGSVINKADKWDALYTKIGKYYTEEEGDGPDGHLCDIGELAAYALGYM